jgi:1-acyl-sn-glycerol-3-phosphate acyltransferase
MPSPLELLRGGARAGGMAVWTFGVMHTAMAHVRRQPLGRQQPTQQRWMRSWASGLLRVFRVRTRWIGAPPQPTESARLVVANHCSPLDIIALLSHFGGCVLSRADLEHWPLLGEAASKGETIFVDRDDPHSGVKAIREIRRRLRDGRTVIVFPEGKTSEGDEVLPFLGGAFAAATGLEVELVPVGIAHQPGSAFVNESFAAHLRRVAGRPSTPICVCVGPPRTMTGSRKQLEAETRDEVQGLVHQARDAMRAWQASPD